MPDAHFAIKQGAQLPSLDATLTKGDGTAQDLTGATVTFSMKRKASGAQKVSAASVTVLTPSLGTVRYSWGALDTDTPGVYFGSFRVTGLAGGPAVFPSDGYIWVTVVAKAST